MLDAADIAADNEARAMALFERQRLEQQVAMPDPQPIDCINCGEPVPLARLRAVPRTLRCARCASEVERR